MTKNFLVAIVIMIAFSCRTTETVPKEVRLYVDEVVDLLATASVNKNQINWDAFRSEVLKKANHAKRIEDSYIAINYAIEMLQDNHSYFRAATVSEQTENKPLPVLPDIPTPDDIAYIRVPFCIGDEQANEDYIFSIANKIKTQSEKELKGWVIDLRGNFGGNMWPMLLAVEALIGNDTLGYFINADNEQQAWRLENGKAYIDDELVLENKAYETLDLTNAYVAVLTDGETASSGEALAVAFKHRAYTKSFGTPTYGVSTGCVSHQLSDGSYVNLAETIFADRQKHKYGFEVQPDVYIKDAAALEQAIAWIYGVYEN